jgi:hypothetical protein
MKALLENDSMFRLTAVWSLLLLFALLVSLTSGKNGSSYNYFMEFNLACCPLAAIAVYRILLSLRPPLRWTTANLILFALPMSMLAPGVPHSVGGMRLFVKGVEYAGFAGKRNAHREALKIVKESPGPVFSEDMLLLVESGKEVPAEPAIIRELAMRSQWDERPFVRMIREKRFSKIVITSDLNNAARFTPAVAEAIADTYQQSRLIGSEYQIFEPKTN